MSKSVVSSFAKAYKIHSVQNKDYVWDSSGNPKELNTLILVKYHGGENQRFYLNPTKNGKWRIMCLGTGYCLQPISANAASHLHFVTVNDAP
jgi:hypothetical protein